MKKLPLSGEFGLAHAVGDARPAGVILHLVGDIGDSGEQGQQEANENGERSVRSNQGRNHDDVYNDHDKKVHSFVEKSENFR